MKLASGTPEFEGVATYISLSISVSLCLCFSVSFPSFGGLLTAFGVGEGEGEGHSFLIPV